MSILVAPDSFKGTFTAAEVAGHIAAGIRTAGAAARELPVADGGEGTTEVLARGLDARPVLSPRSGRGANPSRRRSGSPPTGPPSSNWPSRAASTCRPPAAGTR